MSFISSLLFCEFGSFFQFRSFFPCYCKKQNRQSVFYGLYYFIKNWIIVLCNSRDMIVLAAMVHVYINNSLHLARKYAQIFVRGRYLFREANSFPRAKLEENCELRWISPFARLKENYKYYRMGWAKTFRLPYDFCHIFNSRTQC